MTITKNEVMVGTTHPEELCILLREMGIPHHRGTKYVVWARIPLANLQKIRNAVEAILDPS